MRLASILTPLLLTACSCAALARQVDIRAVGAKCDGATDDAPKVQAAINRLASGDVLLVSCRAGIGGSGLTVRDRRNIAIRGVNGGGFKALAPASLSSQGFSPVMVLVQRCERCSIESLNFEMNRIPEAAIGLDRCVESILSENVVTDVGAAALAGIVASGNRQGKYLSNQVLRTGGHDDKSARGMWIGNGGDSLEWRPEVSGNTVEATGWTGIVVWGRAAVIVGNTVRNASGAGIKVSAAALAGAPSGPQTRIADNTLTANKFHGIQIENGEGGIRIEGNRIEDNSVAGLYLSQGEVSGEVEGNVFAGNREAGVYLYRASGLSIRNNRFDSSTSEPQRHAIVFEVIPGNSVRGVSVVGNSMWEQSSDGIVIWARGGELDGLNISANSFGGRTPVGIHIEDRSGSTSGRISLGPNCFDRQLGRTLADERSAALPAPAAGNCAPPVRSSTAKKEGRRE
jgi:parallel beta-helix repeat protein